MNDKLTMVERNGGCSDLRLLQYSQQFAQREDTLYYTIIILKQKCFNEKRVQNRGGSVCMTRNFSYQTFLSQLQASKKKLNFFPGEFLN